MSDDDKILSSSQRCCLKGHRGEIGKRSGLYAEMAIVIEDEVEVLESGEGYGAWSAVEVGLA